MKFSITIPAYKQKYLYEAIESCLAQTYKDFEVVIVDDASPEDLKSIVDRFIDSRIKYYRNDKNCGAEHVVDNWNICLGYAKGEYVICMGDDDKLLPDCLNEYDKLIEKYPGLNIYHALTEVIDEEGRFCYMQEMRPEREGMYSMIYGRLFKKRQQYIGDWLFQTKWLKEEGGYVNIPMAWGSDDVTAYKAAQKKGVANSQVPMFQYRENQHTISSIGNVLVKSIALMKTFDAIKMLLKDTDSTTTLLDEKYRCSSLRAFERVKQLSKLNLMQQSLATGNVFKTFFWWLRHMRKFDISYTELLKALIKSINKM